MSALDAVDGFSTGTEVPWMWVLLRPTYAIPTAWIPALLTLLITGVGYLLTVWIMQRAKMRDLTLTYRSVAKTQTAMAKRRTKRKRKVPTLKTFDDMQKRSNASVDATMHSFEGVTKITQAIATEVADYSKRSFENVTKTVENLIGAKSLDKAFECKASTPGRRTRIMSPMRLSWERSTRIWPKKPSSHIRALSRERRRQNNPRSIATIVCE
jgi:hypothetical protein